MSQILLTNILLRKKPLKLCHFRPILINVIKCNYSTNSEEVEKPVKYTTSQAYKGVGAGLNPSLLRKRLYKEPAPRCQTPIILLSLISFMLYFCVLREENDIDEMLKNGTLYDHIEGLEKAHLESALETYRQKGWDASKLLERLEQIKEEEQEQEKAKKAKSQAEQ